MVGKKGLIDDEIQGKNSGSEGLGRGGEEEKKNKSSVPVSVQEMWKGNVVFLSFSFSRNQDFSFSCPDQIIISPFCRLLSLPNHFFPQ